MSKLKEEIVIRSLSDRDAVRTRPGMYIGSVSDPNLIFREVIDGSFDESYSTGCDQIIISTDLNKYYFCGDNGRGIPIMMSVDDPTKTQAYLAIAKLHAGAKFNSASEITAGMNGVGESCTNFLSERFILLSRITEDNYNRSIPMVKDVWDNSGPRIRKELYYILVFQQGLLTYEGAMRKCEAEKMLFGKEFKKDYIELPEGLSTMVLFRPDPEIFESTVAELPIPNIQNFLLIQEKYYRRKIRVWADGVEYTSSGFKPYKYEFIKTIVPKDTSLNQNVTFYVTFEVDKDLGNKEESGSVNGLTVNQGIHISWVENYYEKALRAEYKIKHRCIFNGLKIHVLLLASEVLYDSQTKTRLKSISKVKTDDLEAEIVKEFIKIFRKNEEDWELHVNRLNMLADSMRNISAVEKASRIMEEAAGRSLYKSKADMVEGFSDATAGPAERWDCSLYMCFTGDTEILTCNEERIKFTDLVTRLENGENIYTFSCTSEGIIKPAKILAASKIRKTNEIVKITLDNGEVIKCTPDHKFLLRDGSYKEARELVPNESMMPCYIRTIEDSNDDPNYYGKVFKRRVIVSNRISNVYGRPYKAVGKKRNEYYVYRIMATHGDVLFDESYNKDLDNLTRHHIDLNPLNDNPNNILWCSRAWHRAFHGSLAAKKAAEQDPEKYKRMYGSERRTEESKLLQGVHIREYYQTEEGIAMKENLRTKANLEWDNEELRNWRSLETKRYAKEHPEWVAENQVKATRNFYQFTVIPTVINLLEERGLEKNSRNFNSIVISLKEADSLDNKKNRFPYYRQIKETFPDLLTEIEEIENDNPRYLKIERVLKLLEQTGKEVTLKNFNEAARQVYKVESLNNGKGYISSKNAFPDLIEEYQSKLNKNHKISSIEFITLEKPEDVYCLEVDTEEHNFPLAAGIFAKNCEGLSPGGSLKAARPSPKYIAVMPLFGRVKNVKDSSADQIMNNKEFYTLFRIIGLGLDVNNVTTGASSPEEAYERIKKCSRYGKIIIATDADEDGLAIQNGLIFAFLKFAHFLIDFGLIYIAESPIYSQEGKYFYPSDPKIPGTDFRVGMDPNKKFKRYKGLGSLDKSDVYDAFYNPETRRLFQVIPDGDAYAMKLVEDIDARKKLLFDKGILSNPYNFEDI